MNIDIGYLLILVGPLIFTSLLGVGSAGFVFKKERSNVSYWFMILMIALIIWSLCYALELMVLDEYLTLFFAKLKYIGIVFTPVAWLFFSLSYTKKTSYITKKSIIALSLVPLLSLSMLFTNSMHHLFWKTIVFTGGNGVSLVSSSSNLFFWVHTIYSYMLILIGMIYILLMLFRTEDIFTKQNMLVLIGALTPFIGNILIVFDLIQLPYSYDLTPLLFLLSGMLFLIAIFYFKFLELIPAARDEIFEHVTQAIFVTNKNMKIIDKNNSAERLVKQGFISPPDNKMIGTYVDTLFNDVFPQGLLKEIGIDDRTIQLQAEGNEKWFEISMDPLLDKHNNLEGHLITLNDITFQKKTEEELKEKIDELKKFKQVTINRELKMVELKNQIKQLKKEEYGDELG